MVGIQKRKHLGSQCTLVPLHLPGRDNFVADTLSCYVKQMSARDPYPECQFRDGFRKAVVANCDEMSVDLAVCNGGSNRRRALPRSLSNRASEGPLSSRKLWRYPLRILLGSSSAVYSEPAGMVGGGGVLVNPRYVTSGVFTKVALVRGGRTFPQGFVPVRRCVRKPHDAHPQ